MSFTGITVSASGAIAQKAGANFNVNYTDDMMTIKLVNAEAQLNTDTLYDWSANWASLSATRKALISEITSSMVAIEAIRYDMDAVGSAAAPMINSLSNEITENIKSLLNKDKATFVKG